MAPHADVTGAPCMGRTNNFSKPPRLPNDGLHRTISDITFQLSNIDLKEATTHVDDKLPPISEVEDAKCDCCGMSEECTPEYIERIRSKFLGKWICGLCAEAVKEEKEKNGGNIEEALSRHMNTCARFNKLGRAYPVLFQAEAMREILKKARVEGKGLRAKSLSPRDLQVGQKKGGIARSSSCIPAITRQMNDLTVSH
ncbi:hypothetical protein SLEP1_g36373 [Rubroshorea leprosula]|uniref:DUF1677 family protein n=1 Tax=Rubroshorea leprosula TaxID=152421 RepID=A0AAV5KR90_9ROSI|nr:hypothetical protein SLEP1_g36373 [Rubroshorea leprosula]